MAYSKRSEIRNKSRLENMQDEREDLADNAELKKEVQGHIDNHFFGSPGRRKTKKERKKDLKRERMKNREEDY